MVRHSKRHRSLVLGRLVDHVLGYKWLGKPLTVIAKASLRGLGLNVNYEPQYSGELWFQKRFLRLYRGSVCLDVGANIGVYSLMLSRLGASTVFAFEPIPPTFLALCRNVEHEKRIVPVNCAVGESVGEIPLAFPVDAESNVLATRDLSITDVPMIPAQVITSNMTTVDAFCLSEGVQPDFVKIDVEGFELEVIQGGQATFCGATPPKAIQFEFNSHNLRRRQRLSDFADLLPQYRFFRLASHSLRPLEPDHYLSNIFAYCNIIAIQVDVLADFESARPPKKDIPFPTALP
jgi:FkbM family methyltransferase